MKKYIKFLLLAFCVPAIAGCGSALNVFMPTYLGDRNGVPEYSVTGRTAWGEMTKADVRRSAEENIQPMCKDKVVFRNLHSWDGSRMGHHQLMWDAIFNCHLKGEI